MTNNLVILWSDVKSLTPSVPPCSSGRASAGRRRPRPGRSPTRSRPATKHGGPTSVVALAFADLAAEHVVGPASVGQDDRDDQQGTDQREPLALRRRGGGAERHGGRDDVRPQADRQAAIA